MCGIVGEVSQGIINRERFEQMVNALQHRGPDDKGVYFDDSIALGHTRLSILDLSTHGHQPMTASNGEYIIIYNGEVYNFETIKKDLLTKGYKFDSHTDTEVILNGYMAYREKIVDKLNGMFAFAIYEKSSGDLFLARDRSGIKPLYYYKDNEKFLFTSEIKVLKHLFPTVNLEAKILFLLLGAIPEPMTIYEGIEIFPAGHWASYSNGLLIFKKFDEYKYEPKITKSYQEIVEDVRILLHKSVERHLISDAPIGTFLSGGLDSSALTAIATQYRDNFQAFSLIFDEMDHSEEYYQELVVKRCGIKHTKYRVTEKVFLDTLDEFSSSMDQPSVDGLNTYFVSKAANQSGLKTVFSGVGGDEIFYGYPTFKVAHILRIASKIPYTIIKIFQYSHKYKRLELLKAEGDLAFYLPTTAMFSPTQIARLLRIDKILVYNTIARLWNIYNSSHIKSIDDKISFLDLNIYMKNQLLRDADIFGMANSLEIRVPFLDKELVDYVLKIGAKEKFDKRVNKIILADAVRDILPLEVIERPKMGFALPLVYWFKKNIERFEIDSEIKNAFLHDKIHWTRVWADIVLKRFEMDNE